MQLIDTHAHVNLNAFASDADEVLRRAFDHDITVINVGTRRETSEQAVKLLEKYPNKLYAAVGLHPSHTFDDYHDPQEVSEARGVETFRYEAYKELAADSRVVGIGECGLDYYRLPERGIPGVKARQKDAFEQQLKLALELDKALIIHCRPSKGTTDAYDDLLSIFTDRTLPRFEVHSFTGSLEVAQQFVDLGGYVGLNGIITFDKTGESERVVKGLPLESIILETDSPYLTPAVFRGQRNEPMHVLEVTKKIAEWKNESLEKVAEVTTSNAKKLFKM
jgi:TatD DNase family protein